MVTYNQLGQNNGAGVDDALFMTMYGGEVLASFNANNIMDQYHSVDMKDSGNSWKYDKIGRAEGKYWDGATELTGEQVALSEVRIDLNPLLYHDLYIREIDELRDHVSKRAELARQQGEALAIQHDQSVLRMMVLAARAASTITGLEGGTEIIDADADVNATSLAASIYAAATAMDDKYATGERNCFVKPVQYHLLSQTPDVINKDWDGAGSYSKGLIHAIADIGIAKTTNVPTADDTLNTNIPENQRANFSNTVAVITRPDAVKTCRLMGITSEMDYKTEHQATHMVSKLFEGHGIMRPESSVEIKKA